MTPLKRIPLLSLAAAAALALSPALMAQSHDTGSTAGDSNTRSQSSRDRQTSTTGTSTYGTSTLPNAGTTTGSSANLSGVDKAFVKKAASDGLAEVELGRLASEKGTTEEVKSFGRRMVDDHSKANDELKSIASAKGITLPTDTDASHKAKMQKMQTLTGAAFDEAYSKDMVKEHKKDVKLFQKEADKGKDPELKAFAQKTLATLQDHHQSARSMEGTMNHGAMSGRTSRTGTLPAAGDTGTGSTKSGTSSTGGNSGSSTTPMNP